MQRLPFDPFAAPLAGLTLIEASAGTGKTRTITDLYVRLIVETEWQVSQILVVTFTVAATAELRERLRQRLHQACAALRGQPPADPFCAQLRRAYPDPCQALQRLEQALQAFDEAAIYTIHGFCERVLADSAFESGMPFESDILPNERELLQEIVDDFWCREVYEASPLFVRYVLDASYSPESLLQTIQPYVGKPYLQVIPPEPEPLDAPAVVQLEAMFAEAYQHVRLLWQQAAADVEQVLRTSPALNRNRYRLTSISGWMEAMATYLTLETPTPTLCDPFERFTERFLAAAVKRGHQPPQHPFFAACAGLETALAPLRSAYERQLHALKVRLLAYSQSELRQRKRRRQVLSYDDLLINLEQALASPQGADLARAIRRRYAVALIDEFQDTDPVQYRIFQHIYHDTSAPVFFVGDPKQAIYSFRGADIFAYLRACRDTARCYTLTVNWRTDASLLQAINTLFAAARRPFLFDDIPFYPVQPAPQCSTTFTENGSPVSQLRLWFLSGREEGKKVSKQEAEWLSAQATAAEIARLLTLGTQGQAHIGEPSLVGGDIAVLVRSHRQGRQMREALLRLGVSSVQLGQDNIFASWEALELERVLHAVANPSHESLLRGALATVMLGETGERLHALRDHEQAWEDRVAAFHDYHRLWRQDGLAPMLRTLIAREGVGQRLLGWRDGERRLTNLLHLAERLQAAAGAQQSGIEGLLKWLAARRQAEDVSDEEEQLRLESDEHLVKVVTIHKSKGLEYPIVFCPFLWSGSLWSHRDATVSFHLPDHDDPYVDLGSAQIDHYRPQARREEAAENLRLLYVALTRAKHCCYLVWGAIRDIGTSPLAWLLHQSKAVDEASLEAYVNNLSEAALRDDVERYAAQAGGTVHIAPLPEAAGAPYQPPPPATTSGAVRPLPQVPPQHRWRVTSFSALSAGTGASVERPDYDAVASGAIFEPQATAARSIFTFPRGARAGSCLHAIFEHLDFTRQDRAALDYLVTQHLSAHGFDTEWTPVVADMVQRVLTAPLDAAGALTLQQIAPERRLIELEFYYPLAELTAAGLQQVLAAHGFAADLQQEIGLLTFAPARGYMKGFIDLVFEADGRFYLVDYKSNWLGNTIAAYGAAALRQVMARETYFLQYIIYTLALHRYLRLRVPDYDYDSHLGGVFYLFLRGMDPDFPHYGIFRDRPPRQLVQALDAYLETGVPGR